MRSLLILTSIALLAACSASMTAQETTDEPTQPATIEEATNEPATATATATPSLEPTLTPTAAVEPSETPIPLPSPTLAPPIGDPDPLVIAYSHGGLCIYGLCEATTTIYKNGAYRSVAGNVISGGFLASVDMEEFNRQIEAADFEAIRAVPFTDICPTAYDGQEVVFTFYTEHGEERVASCEHQIDPKHPLFAMMEWLLSPQESSPSVDETLLLQVYVYGMMGADIFTVDIDGSYQRSPGLTGTLSDAQLESLREMIEQTDFELMRAYPPGFCPLAIDIPVATYFFRTAHGVELISECANGIDHEHPLIAWVDALIESLGGPWQR